MTHTNTYEVRECFHWAREGFSSRALHVVEHEGFEKVSSGFRIYKNGSAIFTAYHPFETARAALEQIFAL